MKLLELFSGTESISKVFRSHGVECVTVDNNLYFAPDYCQSILDFKTKEKFDVIWASPPCTCFSCCFIN